MTLQMFEPWNPRGASLDIVDRANSILGEYQADQYTLTLRQLYYQFVARGLLPNTERSYKNLGRIVTQGRMAGLISWDAIEDRGRNAYQVAGEKTPEDVLHGIEGRLILDPWKDQDYYVEVWIEKEALHNVIERPCDEYRVTHMACKGYLSASEAWRSGRRLRFARRYEGKTPVIIHLGDHDPSGIDMTRDNQDRSGLFSQGRVEVRRIALNMDQVREYSPPPNPAKMTDSRANDYIVEHGYESWELDALDPKVLDKLIRDNIAEFITDWDAWEASFAEETELRARLSEIGPNWDRVSAFLEKLSEDD